jgi:hypothetical protein
VKEDDISRACSTHGREDECTHNFHTKREHKDNLDLDGKKIIVEALEK